jgi:hypothetical protein
MDWGGLSNPAESAVDVLAAAIFAAAVAFAVSRLTADAGPAPLFVAIAAFLAVHAALRHIPADERSYALPAFRPAPIELEPEAQGESTEELLLDDMLAVAPDARVVRLFGRQRPGAGELHASIDRNILSNRSRPAPPDASQALSDALAELRRSLL